MIKSLSIWNSNTTFAEWALSLSNIGIKKAAVLPEPVKKVRKVFFKKASFTTCMCTFIEIPISHIFADSNLVLNQFTLYFLDTFYLPICPLPSASSWKH